MRKLALAAFAAMSLFAGAPAHAELVVNGGFEFGIITDREPTNMIFAWITRGDVGIENSQSEFIHSGSASAALHEPEIAGRIAQLLPTTAGQSYELSYWAFHFFDPLGTLRVNVDGVVTELTNTLIDPWTQFTVDFTASSDSTLLEFTNARRGYFIDDVSVVEKAAIPEPGSAPLLGVGAVAFLLSRRRRWARAS